MLTPLLPHYLSVFKNGVNVEIGRVQLETLKLTRFSSTTCQNRRGWVSQTLFHVCFFCCIYLCAIKMYVRVCQLKTDEFKYLDVGVS